MPEASNPTTLSKGVAEMARDAAYVAVGLGVLGYQRAQVQRVELQKKLAKDASLDQRLTTVRQELAKGIQHLDDLIESAAQALEQAFQPLEQQLPAPISQLTTRAFDQARQVRGQIRQRVTSA